MQTNNLIQKALKGNHQSLKQLYDQNVKEMFATSYRITNDMQASEDVIQESFLTSFDKLNTLTDIKNYRGWLRRIVINNSIKYIRSKKIFTEVEANLIVNFDETEGKDWFSDISFDVIRDAIQQLPDGARTVFSLYALEGYKHREIANMQSISEATSKTQYRYAKKLLKTALTKQIQL